VQAGVDLESRGGVWRSQWMVVNVISGARPGFSYTSLRAAAIWQRIPPGIIIATTVLIVSFFLSSRWEEGKRIFVISSATFLASFVRNAVERTSNTDGHSECTPRGHVYHLHCRFFSWCYVLSPCK